jgi:hypothetical protein
MGGEYSVDAVFPLAHEPFDQLLSRCLVSHAPARRLSRALRSRLSNPVRAALAHQIPTLTLHRTASLPVRYVFPKRSLDIKSVVEALYTTAFPDGKAEVDETIEEGVLPEDREARGRKGVVVFWDVAYDWIEGMSFRRYS